MTMRVLVADDDFPDRDILVRRLVRQATELGSAARKNGVRG